ncbi:VOC family protein [Chitinophaga polysaccharea]|uniref:SMU1112c/YaeR family gloxylase I-like metalloprotein n=1 Tax=Chitinophaga TaxID=79328 RepID=UPI00145508B5|nr:MULTISPECIES: VOC family protein [Chitinophaga]NLR60115.1 VOC family protein [Chitinophaga polysaccharea]NLU94344.1 VOC family protein [Chitinophaga sp. Ak27]
MLLQAVHHIAIICADYNRSKVFYTDVLGLQVIREVYREERDSWKLDLALGNQYIIELFSFPNPPPRVSRPEACGLRHLAFAVADITVAVQQLLQKGVTTEPVRIDPHTQQRFTFFTDPDGLPLELYEVVSHL